MDFSQMLFNVEAYEPHTDLLAKFPRLQRYEEFTKLDIKIRSLAIRFICLMYDLKSPLIKDYPNYEERTRVVIGMIDIGGLDREIFTEFTGPWGEQIIEAIICFNTAIQRSRKWQNIVSNEKLFWDLNRELMTSLSETDEAKKMQALERKSRIRLELDIIDKELDKYYVQMFEGDTRITDRVLDKLSSPEGRAKHA